MLENVVEHLVACLNICACSTSTDILLIPFFNTFDTARNASGTYGQDSSLTIRLEDVISITEKESALEKVLTTRIRLPKNT